MNKRPTAASHQRTGNDPDFYLTRSRREVYLFTGDAVREADGLSPWHHFEASAHGVSFGRYVNSVGEVDLTAMSALSFGHDNPISVADFRLGTGLPNPYRNFPPS